MRRRLTFSPAIEGMRLRVERIAHSRTERLRPRQRREMEMLRIAGCAAAWEFRDRATGTIHERPACRYRIAAEASRLPALGQSGVSRWSAIGWLPAGPPMVVPMAKPEIQCPATGPEFIAEPGNVRTSEALVSRGF